MPDHKRLPVIDITLAVLMIALGVAIFSVSSEFRRSALEPIGPSAFPLAVAIILIALSGAVLLTALVRGRTEPAVLEYRKRNDLALIALGLTIAYFAVMGMEWMRFHWATVAYIFLLTAHFDAWQLRRLPGAMVIALVMGIGLKFIFTRILFLDLP
ncbi:MAG: tripartite tricarboxylate transporter TctB family protein [Rhodospirillales bacterium]|jgi:hypothetical protein|nr:tripartite tricarboxylate transporter TctB family protein [Rhodospirillales bacterium]MDP6644484.1 tripartite tricarboxylate transporter TctB family protein [Rhodospirillales bacterium]MDP6840211.1 tripartite tricarboxylate transporter TctB family protein [Rhodospirillales bacterium]|tara:strand:+ start:1414 stop:1881 length:468 start_codon:yes stop_codon:yes gene_type:complete